MIGKVPASAPAVKTPPRVTLPPVAAKTALMDRLSAPIMGGGES
jgi:hypothetical protein